MPQLDFDDNCIPQDPPEPRDPAPMTSDQLWIDDPERMAGFVEQVLIDACMGGEAYDLYEVLATSRHQFALKLVEAMENKAAEVERT